MMKVNKDYNSPQKKKNKDHNSINLQRYEHFFCEDDE